MYTEDVIVQMDENVVNPYGLVLTCLLVTKNPIALYIIMNAVFITFYINKY